MKAGYIAALLVCGFAASIAFIALLLVPQISSVRTNQVELGILETRARLVLDVAVSQNELHLSVLSLDELFASMARIRETAFEHGLDVEAFTASEVDNFGIDVAETVVRATIIGNFEDAVTFVSYLAEGVYNIRYLSLVNAETASFDVLISIFHE